MAVDKEKLLTYAKKGCSFIVETGREGAQGHVDRECDEAREYQKADDIIKLVMALSEYGAKEDDIYEALSKYYRIDSREEAKYYIQNGRYIEWPLDKLRTYLRKNGERVTSFIREHQVIEQLKENPKLCTLSGEKLKVALEKK